MEGLQLSIFNRLRLIKVTACLGLIFSMLFSYNLWFGQRWFPLSPFIENFKIDPLIEIILFFTHILLLCILLITDYRKLTIFLIICSSVILILLDQNRLQPWFFIYNSVLVILFFYNWRIDNVNHYNSFFIILQLTFAAIYLYSGLQKMNSNFIIETYPWFIKPLNQILSERQVQLLSQTGYVVPIYEIALGIGLLYKPFRFISIPMLLILHILIIMLMGPFGHNYNSVVWPWNIAMMAFGIFLFSGRTTERYFSKTQLFKMPIFYLVIVFFWIMPAFNLANKWETYLSFSLYSGNNHNGKILMNQRAYDHLPFYIRAFVKKDYENEYFLYPKWWCLSELNVPMYPEKRVFEKVTNYIVNITETSPNDVKLVYIEKQKFFDSEK